MIFARDKIASSPAVLQPVETELLRSVAGETMLWCGRGATALIWAYRVARARRPAITNPQVIVPAISCASLANTAFIAGLSPRFADVDADTGLITLARIQERCTPRTIAVVFIHLYGQTADLTALAAWCRQNEILLIEDNAHALGALLPGGAPVGTVGDMSIYSFNRTKILECGGGALLLRTHGLLAELEDELETFTPPPRLDAETESLLQVSYRNLHHSLVALMRLRAASRISDLFLPVRPAYDGLYSRSMKDAAVLPAVWRELPQVVARRREHAELYAEKLAGGPWRLLNGWQTSGVCWRYSLLIDAARQLVQFSEAVRRDGFHVSNLYWPLNDFYRPDDLCPQADSFARRIVNLWVDSSVDREWVGRCADSLRRRADELLASKAAP